MCLECLKASGGDTVVDAVFSPTEEREHPAWGLLFVPVVVVLAFLLALFH